MRWRLQTGTTFVHTTTHVTEIRLEGEIGSYHDDSCAQAEGSLSPVFRSPCLVTFGRARLLSRAPQDDPKRKQVLRADEAKHQRCGRVPGDAEGQP